MAKKPILVSGIQPTGRLHIGNYLGALKNFIALQNSDTYQCYFCVVDLHSLTEEFDPKEKQGQILNLAADFLAAGIDTKKSNLFLQSLVPAHSELTWILNTITPMEELARMAQFKTKTQLIFEYLDSKHKGETRYSDEVADDFANDLVKNASAKANVGLFDYPVLMAADIMLYGTAVVPVGDDQDQHLELTRTLARKFNSRFGETFIEPKALHTPTPRVMSLSNPKRKMSKSEPAGCVFLDDSPEEINKKIMRAVTDSDSEVRFDEENKPAISNLLEIYSALSGAPIPQLEKKFNGKGYGEFKSSLAEVITHYFADFRKRKAALLAKPQTLATILKKGSAATAKIASKKMLEVKKKIGIAL